MVYKIIWSPLAIRSYVSNIEYLETAWTKNETVKFVSAVENKISLLKIHPKVGKLTAKRLNLRQTAIHKRIILIYRIKPLKNEVELVRFFNTYQSPRRLKKK